MRVKKTDFTVIKEAESAGMMASTTNIVRRERTVLTDELSLYFRRSFPNFKSMYSDDEAEEVLDILNTYIKESMERRPLDFPVSSSTDVHLLPISQNLQLEVMIMDEYYGDGDYCKCVEMGAFLINEDTTKRDVDSLIHFFKKLSLI